MDIKVFKLSFLDLMLALSRREETQQQLNILLTHSSNSTATVSKQLGYVGHRVRGNGLPNVWFKFLDEFLSRVTSKDFHFIYLFWIPIIDFFMDIERDINEYQ